ncbi:AbiJ-NTD4 domain-containing protein [Saccharicrinis sp. FJH2]|uniref:AbiJ-NTD4 domain-containing protein n=1 Tax=Saccharicrinis sp. FJH65 TaxID=3344659 RepID=UPI0035F40049
MDKFSYRMGIIKRISQKDYMNDDLRIRLFNVATRFYFEELIGPDADFIEGCQDVNLKLYKSVWMEVFKQALDEMPRISRELFKEFKIYFKAEEWYYVIEFIEFLSNNYGKNEDSTIYNDINNGFRHVCNDVLQEESSAYRFVDGLIVPIGDKISVQNVEDTLNVGKSHSNVRSHIKSALELFSNKKNPDFRNSIKESISAVEALICNLTEKPKIGFSDGLILIEKKYNIDASLRKAFVSIYGYTCNENGIRHKLINDSKADYEDAQFMLVSCSAFINYVLGKVSKCKP